MSPHSLDPVLASLSPKDVKVLDDIIAKASDATAFTTVFKAYSDVLRQKGLDPGEDVVYYKQLLKLGVVKGVNWGVKWRTVKAQLPAANVPPTSAQFSPASVSSIPLDSDDVFLSKTNDTTTTTKVSTNNISIPGFETPDRSVPKFYHTRHKIAPTPVSSSLNEANRQIKRPLSNLTQPLGGLGFRTPTKYVTSTPKSTSSGNNETWKKIDETRLIQNADYYRKQALLLTHFHIWKRGLEWTRVTLSQIDQARVNIQFRVYFLRWRSVFIKLQRQAREAIIIERKRSLYFALQRWYKCLAKRRVRKFNEKLNFKASNFQQKREQRLCRDMWMKWYQLHLAEQFYLHHLLLRTFKIWSMSLRNLDHLEILADQFEEEQDRHSLRKMWDFWHRRSNWRNMELYVVKRYSSRLLKQSFQHLLRQTRQHKLTNNIHKSNLCKRSFKLWQKAFSRKETMVLRSDKYINRCNTYLLRAVMRVWLARERGQLLSRIRDVRIVHTSLTTWQHQLHAIHTMQDQAVLFSQRISVQFLKASFTSWKQKLQFHHAQKALAKERHMCVLAYNVLLKWRLRLRDHLSSFRTAKIVRRYFLLKIVWNRWQFSLESAKRKKKLGILEQQFIKKFFTKWTTKYQWRKHERGLLEEHAKLTRKHILNKYTKFWTNRTILIKLREMDIGDRYNKQLLSDVFGTWKAAHSRNLENLSLARSYLDVKREEKLRRTFAAWLTKAQKTKVDRLREAEEEEENRLNILTMVWERWRDRFCENALREAELEVLIRNQRNTLRHAFSSWLSHCNSIPGIRLYATNLKSKMWRKWREALPRAVQAGKAQDVHARRLLRRTFDMWKEAHRMKIALKAVTRARYLRLPGPGYRASFSDERDSPAIKPPMRRPLRNQLPITPGEKAPLSSNEYNEQFSSNTSPSRLSPINLPSRVAGPNFPASHRRSAGTGREEANDNNEHNVRTQLWTRLRNAQVARNLK